MPSDGFNITGADQFNSLSKALKAAGRKDLRTETNKGLQKAVKPLTPKTREAAKSQLPKRKGLAAKVAKAPQRVKVSTGKDPGVRLVVGKNGSAARGTNRGKFKHPTFGNREEWVEQETEAGWFDETVKDNLGEVLPECEKALERVAEKIVQEVRRGQ